MTNVVAYIFDKYVVGQVSEIVNFTANSSKMTQSKSGYDLSTGDASPAVKIPGVLIFFVYNCYIDAYMK